jgi:hypothetical protein
VKKDQIFWIVWAVVVLGAGAFYFFVVSGMRERNKELLQEKRFLAARFVQVKDETARIKKMYATKSKEEKKKYAKVKLQEGDTERKLSSVDPILWRLYPLTQNLKLIPNKNFVAEKKNEDAALKAARADFIKRMGKYQFAVKPGDFKPPPPDELRDRTMALFREWARDEDLRIDKEFKKKGRGIEYNPQTADLLTPTNRGPRWMDDGRVTGYMEKQSDRHKVLYRLLLRRQILMALARTRADVRRLKLGADRKTEEPAREPRVVDKLISLRFVDQRTMAKGFPYKPERVELTVSCQVGVLPALLRELEAIGARRNVGSDRLEQIRPFAFWAEEVQIKRPTSWPEGMTGSAEISSERASEYGRYFEWPVTVFISGVVPQFDQNLDPEPKAKGRPRGRARRR